MAIYVEFLDDNLSCRSPLVIGTCNEHWYMFDEYDGATMATTFLRDWRPVRYPTKVWSRLGSLVGKLQVSHVYDDPTVWCMPCGKKSTPTAASINWFPWRNEAKKGSGGEPQLPHHSGELAQADKFYYESRGLDPEPDVPPMTECETITTEDECSGAWQHGTMKPARSWKPRRAGLFFQFDPNLGAAHTHIKMTRPSPQITTRLKDTPIITEAAFSHDHSRCQLFKHCKFIGRWIVHSLDLVEEDFYRLSMLHLTQLPSTAASVPARGGLYRLDLTLHLTASNTFLVNQLLFLCHSHSAYRVREEPPLWTRGPYSFSPSTTTRTGIRLGGPPTSSDA
ncbi:protein ORF21 [Cyprinid herpesvirus 3]|uniref:ORF21R n=1 Tax=Cyprinid herpesvirus 3 TaxID=180230 RepID=A3QMJ3_CYHV3|nr:unnamed protein product [Cyprinid herpesvirus 3]ABF81800.1 hypothetical protein [Cyprinid herpesvirus 3]ABG42852.1 protein ORF21 [Cyprinid herpesvirus 3]AIC32376.1 ORF21R [Cyprinid herpesvirus 3]AJP55515.1 protein ORF21 [Cyprinid herpesvirus 3]AJP55672.1 protein ORF21 [Cyprinid herpesvirus 3]